MMRPGLALAAAVLVLDQASKWFVLAEVMRPPRVLEVTGFFNLVLVWNPGISFGLLGEAGPWQAWLLAAFGTVVAGGLLVWLHRAALGRLASTGVGLIVGGALGNVVDRLRFGAVVDFIRAHAWGWNWYVFNIADAAIVCGVVVLLADALFRRPTQS